MPNCVPLQAQLWSAAILMMLVVAGGAVGPQRVHKLEIRRVPSYTDSLVRILCIAGPDTGLSVRLHCPEIGAVCYENCAKTLQCLADPLCAASTCQRQDSPGLGEFALGFSFPGGAAGLYECRYRNLIERLEVRFTRPPTISTSTSSTSNAPIATAKPTQASTTTSTATEATTISKKHQLKTSASTIEVSTTETANTVAIIVSSEVASSSPPLEQSFILNFSSPLTLLLSCLLTALCVLLIAAPVCICMLWYHGTRNQRHAGPAAEAHAARPAPVVRQKNEYVVSEDEYDSLDDLRPVETSGEPSVRQPLRPSAVSALALHSADEVRLHPLG